VLRNDPVYQNDREGFRFLVPEGWRQTARTDLPPGRYPIDKQLVEYRLATAGKGVLLQVSLADLPESTNLAELLGAPTLNVKDWRPVGAAEPLEVNGKSGVRLVFTGHLGKDEMIREVVTFRRGERVYFFTGMFGRTNTTARDQMRQAVVSTTWKN
jgi:hypothetical protein